MDNVLFYNLGINNCFESFVIELDTDWKNNSENNNYISEYCYEKVSNNSFKIYKEESDIVSFSFEISTKHKNVYEIWLSAIKNICNSNFNNKKYIYYILELNVKGKDKIKYNSPEQISIKKIIDGVMLSLCKVKKDDFVAHALLCYNDNQNKNDDKSQNIGFFDVNNLFTIQSNPPDDKLVGITYKFETSDKDNYEISVKLSSATK